MRDGKNPVYHRLSCPLSRADEILFRFVPLQIPSRAYVTMHKSIINMTDLNFHRVFCYPAKRNRATISVFYQTALRNRCTPNAVVHVRKGWYHWQGCGKFIDPDSWDRYRTHVSTKLDFCSDDSIFTRSISLSASHIFAKTTFVFVYQPCRKFTRVCEFVIPSANLRRYRKRDYRRWFLRINPMVNISLRYLFWRANTRHDASLFAAAKLIYNGLSVGSRGILTNTFRERV